MSLTTAALATSFKKLHQPGNPVIVVNIWDAVSANAAGTVSGVKALATASYAVAATYGVSDNDLTYEQNLAAISRIAPIAQKLGLPLTVDLQDGYEDIARSITELIKLGVVGANIEDLNDRTGNLRSKSESAERIRTAVVAAKSAGVPDFVINARTDVVAEHGNVDDAIDRAKAYLEAGATTAFVWGGRHGLRDAEVEKITEALGGRLSVVLPGKSGYLSVGDVGRIGVARVSIGPRLQFDATAAIIKGVKELLS